MAYSFEMEDDPRVFIHRCRDATRLQSGEAVQTRLSARSLFQTKRERGRPVPGIATLAKLSMMSCL